MYKREREREREMREREREEARGVRSATETSLHFCLILLAAGTCYSSFLLLPPPPPTSSSSSSNLLLQPPPPPPPHLPLLLLPVTNEYQARTSMSHELASVRDRAVKGPSFCANSHPRTHTVQVNEPYVPSSNGTERKARVEESYLSLSLSLSLSLTIH